MAIEAIEAVNAIKPIKASKVVKAIKVIKVVRAMFRNDNSIGSFVSEMLQPILVNQAKSSSSSSLL